MLMIAPRRSTSAGNRRWVSVARAVMLVSIICRHCSRLARWAGAVPSARPALLTSTSMPRNGAGIASSAACIASASRMSNAATCRRSPPSSSRSACRRPARRPVATTCQPSARKRRTVAAPNPAVAPVTRMVRVMGWLRRGEREVYCERSPQPSPAGGGGRFGPRPLPCGGGNLQHRPLGDGHRGTPCARRLHRLVATGPGGLLLPRPAPPRRRLAARCSLGRAVLLQHALGQHHVLRQQPGRLGDGDPRLGAVLVG